MKTEEEQFAEDFNNWLLKIEREIENIIESEVITAEDSNIRINTIQY